MNREEDLREGFRNVWLRATCDQLYHTLPRELRDLIYDDLIEGSCMEMVPNDSRMIGADDYIWRLQHDQHGPEYHCHNDNLIGRHVLRELIQNILQSITISTDASVAGGLQDILTRDIRSLHVKPVEHLRIVHLDIHEGDFGHPNLLRNLELLLQLETGAQLYIKLFAFPNRGLEAHGYEGSAARCGAGICVRWGSQSFFARSKSDILIFFEKLRPILSILRSIAESKNVSLKVMFYNENQRAHTWLTLWEPDKTMEFSLNAWMRLVNQQKKVMSQVFRTSNQLTIDRIC